MRLRFNRRPFLIILTVGIILAGLAAAAVVDYRHNGAARRPLVYSNNAMLYELWVNYKANVIEPGSGRTVDRQQGNDTTSEGQSYTMLRAVWIDDKATFDKSWQWSQKFQQRPDHLFMWKYGQRSDGSYGILTASGGANTAADGDTDIALALLMAYSRWGDIKYLEQAKLIIPSIWNQEVVLAGGHPVMTADDLEKNSPSSVVVNPSYFAPYAYKIFAKVDPTHDWNALADNSYALLNRMSQAKLGSPQSDGLPPDWVIMNRQTAALSPPPAANSNMDTNYGYDAMRIAWRLGLDYSWYHDQRDKNVLANFQLLGNQFASTGKLTAIYSHAGQPLTNYESPAAYGTAIGYFKVIDPAAATKLYNHKLTTLYNPDTQGWVRPLSYYDDNWAWFGMALQLNALPNLTENTP